MQIDRQRVMALAGTRNFRDLGGYATLDGRRTRWRTVYRSECVAALDEAGQGWLTDAGLRTTIDLRNSDEAAEQPSYFAESSQVAYRSMSMWGGPTPARVEPDIRNGYIREVDACGERLASIIGALGEPGALPALIHCAAGKDRTGIVSALLLAAVDVPSETIAEDYALSRVCLGPEGVEAARRWALSQGLDWEVYAHIAETPPERMLMTLAYIERKFGGVKQYLVDHGLAEERLIELREAFTEAER